ncbi:hypothetical protein [Duncaniella muris]|uniref:hypothetical protein n=1 Tax=Duncaniella muris TaxID=2094150 RepID=UPI003F6647EF
MVVVAQAAGYVGDVVEVLGMGEAPHGEQIEAAGLQFGAEPDPALPRMRVSGSMLAISVIFGAREGKTFMKPRLTSGEMETIWS